METNASFSKTTPNVSQDSARELFRQHLRQADKLIIEGKFSDAKYEISEAKKLDPRNPFIIAFEERIALFENKIVSSHKKSTSHHASGSVAPSPVVHPPKEIQEGEIPTRESLEQKLRAQIENEYKVKFTQELRKAEELAAKILDEERAKLERQRQILKGKYDEQLEEIQKQLEQQYQQKLDEEIAKAEERLNQQHEAEQAFIEKEMKSELTKQHETDLKNLRELSTRDKEELIQKEQQAFQEREQTLKEEFDRKLRETLSKVEENCGGQKQQGLDLEKEQIRKTTAAEYEAKLADDKKSLMQEFQSMKVSLEENYLLRKSELDAEIEKKVHEKQDALIKTEEEKYEKKRALLRKELEVDFQKKYEQQLSEQRDLFHIEASKELEAEKRRSEEEIKNYENKLEEKFNAKLIQIDNRIKKEFSKQHETELQELQENFKLEKEELKANELRAFQEREQILKEKFNQKLLESLRKAEVLFQEQSKQQIQFEREKIKKHYDEEFKKKFLGEKEALEKEFDEAKTKLEKFYLLKENKINSTIETRVQEQLKILQEIEEEKFEQSKIVFRKELEKESHAKYENRIVEETERIQNEANAIIEAEKKRFEEEYERLIQKQNEQLQKVRSDLRNEMEATFLARLERVAQEYDHKMDLLGAKIPEAKEERLALYKQKMYSCYEQGQPSVDGARDLMKLKELFELTFDEHLNVESEVRLELYSRCVEKKIHSGALEPRNTDELERLKQQFNITGEEATKLEPYILSCFQRLVTKGRLLVVDDDLLLLKSLEDLLYNCDYQVITAPDISTALEKLDTESFDLILSDIKFGVDELDGFKFFKVVQERENLRKIPFVFMSALQDGVIIRSGVQLGVDDYITKPMDPDLLIATIEGKLKRFRNIHRN